MPGYAALPMLGDEEGAGEHVSLVESYQVFVHEL